jgi:nitrate reductase gamma subunit
MTTTQIIEVAVAVALIVGAVILYRRRGAEGEARTGSQTAVLMLIIGLILAIHGLGLMEYRPSQGELERLTAGTGR